ncbi:DUF2637 domain-containing protein [Leifsonia sp. Leaf264]|uniref:DUF2637 domain-containing protein n=1 Tax=Leifsonia sp. Leaf264 TaxID=1736314 RepID=UPI0006FC9957|nr:DUF2637 domain-containing protein [Leifsonia sp. Leaf264]KQO98303.1 hypothetical protein ASF30_09595 [Leifsonia sp. Leaf264]
MHDSADPTLTLQQETGRPSDRLVRWLLWPVALTLVVIIANAFVISFQSQVDLAILARIHKDVAFGWPIIVDGTIVVSTFAAFMLHRHGVRVSWYPWAILILFGAVSIWANGIHATGADVSLPELFLVGAVPAVGILLSVHLFVIVIAHHNRPDPVRPQKASPAAELPAAAAPAHRAPQAVVTDAAFTDAAVTELPKPPRPVAVELPAAPAPELAASNAHPTWVPETVLPKAAPSPQPASKPAPKETKKAAAPRTTTKPMTRAEAGAKVRELETAGTQVTADDISSWMNVSPARAATILTQIRQEAV